MNTSQAGAPSPSAGPPQAGLDPHGGSDAVSGGRGAPSSPLITVDMVNKHFGAAHVLRDVCTHFHWEKRRPGDLEGGDGLDGSPRRHCHLEDTSRIVPSGPPTGGRPGRHTRVRGLGATHQ